MVRPWTRTLISVLLAAAVSAAGPAEARSDDLGEVTATIHPDLPAVRFELKGHKEGPVLMLRSVEFYWGDDNDPAQVISTGGARTRSIQGSGFLLEDVNFDGYKDLRIQAFVPDGTDIPYLYWLYVPEAGRFEGNRKLEEIPSPSFLPEERVIRSVSRSSDTVRVTRSYRYVDGVPELFRIEETRIDSKEGVKEVTVQALKEGRWVMAEKRRVSLWSSLSFPPILSVEQRVSHAPEPWEVRSEPIEHRVTRLTVTDGRPEEPSVCPWDRQDTRDDRHVLVWELDPSASPGPHWITLHYRGTSMVLSRPLPESASSFRAVFLRAKGPGGDEVLDRIEVR